MAESVGDNTAYTQDLFSPLQFCEVVEEGHQQSQTQSLQPLHSHQHSPLTQQTITGLQVAQNHHHHTSAAGQVQGQNQIHPPQQQVQPQQQQSIKQEITQQTIQNPVLNNNDAKSQPLIASFSSMEIFLTSNPVQLQSVGTPMVAIHQQTLSQPMYQVQLTRHQHQTSHVNSIPLSNHPSDVHVSHHPEPSQRPLPLPPNSTPLAVETVVSVNTSESYESMLQTKTPTTNAVATQTTIADHSEKFDEEEPEIIFTNVSSESQSLSNGKKTDFNKSKLQISRVSSSLPVGNSETKSIPIKRTWRRPWKKKKDREKRQPIKKTRRMKRRKISMPKKNVIHVDPRHGPPIDTSNTIVERESEETINQLKQKRQRIKLNRNSGREYVNRLGKIVRARKIGSPCNCPLKCWDRMGSKIIDIFNNFWDLCDFNLQNSYLFTCLKLCDVKRRYTKKPAEESRRQNTFEYFVRISGKHLRVCKKAFMSSHGLTSDKRLRTLFSQMKEGALVPEPDRRGKHLRPSKTQSNGHHFSSHNNNTLNNSSHHNNNNTNHNSNNNNNNTYNGNQNKINSKQKNGRYKKKLPQPPPHRIDSNKQSMYTPPTHPVSHLHTHCTPPPPPAHGTSMQEPPHTYIPNGDIYFPGHYLEPPQAMAPPHMNQIPSCQKMLETPAYFMAGMKENTFHQ